MRSLYVHFPFCESKCHYCDFYSLGREKTREGDPLKFEQALTLECRRQAHLIDGTLDTIFFGGGTPSMTPVSEMARALAPLELNRRVGPETEWTMEANPSSVTLESLQAYRAFGVNRISMGVQAMRDDLLARLGRVHSKDAALRALEAIFAAGFENVSVDLLCGVPGQTIADIESAIEELTAFPITHLSCYLLTLAPHHRMFPDLPNEVEQEAHLFAIDRLMTERGFDHYEISNYAKPGRRARHNLGYWKGSSYLGLGPSAHSFDATTSSRWKNVSSLHVYADRLQRDENPIEWTESLTPEQRRLEEWMLALRLDEGFPQSWLKTPLQRSRAEELLERGYLRRHPARDGYLRLSTRGYALSDSIIKQIS